MGNQYYTYRGTEFDVHLPYAEPKKRQPRIAGPATCGTRSGYTSHRKAGEDACRPCKDANQAYNIDYEKRRAGRQIKKGWTGKKCGTVAGFKSHYRHSQPMCQPCRQANAQYCKDARARRAAA